MMDWRFCFLGTFLSFFIDRIFFFFLLDVFIVSSF